MFSIKVLKPGPDCTVWLKNLEPFIFAVLLASRTSLWEKSRDSCEPRSDLTVLRTVIRVLLMVPYFPLNLNLKKKKKWRKGRRRRRSRGGAMKEKNDMSVSFFFSVRLPLLFLLIFVMYVVWFLTFSFLVFIMTTLTLAASIGNIESFLSSPHVYSTLTLAA